MKKLITCVLYFGFLASAWAQDKKCNPVSILVSNNQSRISEEARNKAESLYKESVKLSEQDRFIKIQEAFLKYREAYKLADDDRNRMGSSIMEHRCKDLPMVFGTPKNSSEQ